VRLQVQLKEDTKRKRERAKVQGHMIMYLKIKTRKHTYSRTLMGMAIQLPVQYVSVKRKTTFFQDKHARCVYYQDSFNQNSNPKLKSVKMCLSKDQLMKPMSSAAVHTCNAPTHQASSTCLSLGPSQITCHPTSPKLDR
jgi:hypothetical protein